MFDDWNNNEIILISVVIWGDLDGEEVKRGCECMLGT